MHERADGFINNTVNTALLKECHNVFGSTLCDAIFKWSNFIIDIVDIASNGLVTAYSKIFTTCL